MPSCLPCGWKTRKLQLPTPSGRSMIFLENNFRYKIEQAPGTSCRKVAGCQVRAGEPANVPATRPPREGSNRMSERPAPHVTAGPPPYPSADGSTRLPARPSHGSAIKRALQPQKTATRPQAGDHAGNSVRFISRHRFTRCGGALAQWQSSGLLSHWFRVRVPDALPGKTPP